MKPIDQPADLKDYYQKRTVVDNYMERRTAQPLNGLLHHRQITLLNDAIAQRHPQAVLEIACGPGRLTTAVRAVRFGVAIDASQPMLEMAHHRTNGHSAHWTFVRTDAFVLPFHNQSFDLVYTFRFIRHFQLADRQRLYAEIRRVLRPHGALLVDALNRDVSLPYRKKRGVDAYHIYDVLYRREEIQAELEAAGFRVAAVHSIIKHPTLQRRLNRLRRLKLDRIARVLVRALEYVPGSNPTDWLLLCEKHV